MAYDSATMKNIYVITGNGMDYGLEYGETSSSTAALLPSSHSTCEVDT